MTDLAIVLRVPSPASKGHVDSENVGPAAESEKMSVKSDALVSS